jgi:hypothetical protein
MAKWSMWMMTNPWESHPLNQSLVAVERQPPVPPGYVIEASANDETFIIIGEVFKAKTYCFGFEKGDRVKFLSGSPFGACATATILNLGTGNTCEVWCE